MNLTLRASLAVSGLAAAVLSLAACGPKSSHATSSVSATTSRLAHDKQVKAAERHWKPVVENCDKGQHWLTHPVRSGEHLLSCSTQGLSKAQKDAAARCIGRGFFRNGLHHAAARDEATLVLCLARVAPPKAAR